MCTHLCLIFWPYRLYVAWQAHLSIEFSRQEYWSGLPYPTPGDRPNLGIKLVSPASGGIFCINCATWEGFIGLQGHNFNLCPCHLMTIFPLGLYVITWHSSLGVLVSVSSFFFFYIGVYLIWISQVAVVVMNPPANVKDRRDLNSTPGLGRPPGGGHDNPLQYSCLEKPMHRWVWWATVYEVAKSRTRLKWFSTHACVVDLQYCVGFRLMS